jgi:hypothetical protein
VDTETEDDTVKITALSRRHVLAGAAATVAAAALPAVAVAHTPSWSMDFIEEDGGWRLLSWQPNTMYQAGQIVMDRGRRVCAKCDHVSGDFFRTRNWLLLEDTQETA